MSMLAERKRKTKWVINPTKKPLWKSDLGGIKLGKELMEKMGWAPGKGLGLREQGMQEPLRVSYKNDTKGMGFKGNDEDWIEHQNEFNSFLSELTNSNDDVIVKTSTEEKNKIKSLEEESKKSKARIHYKKFTREKDLAQYSENDLACILGTNKTKKGKNVEENPLKKENEKQTEEGYETSFGVTTINSGSIQDYFKKKWGPDKHKSDNCGVLGDMSDKTVTSEEPLDVDAKENEGEGEKKKRKGKKRKWESPEHLIEENNSEDIESETVNFESEKPKHKKKKHLVKDEIQIKQETEEIDELSGVTNSQGESSYGDNSVSETQIVDSESLCRKHKKKKKKSQDEVEKKEEETEGALIMEINELSTGVNSQVDYSEKNATETDMLNIEEGEKSQLVNENHQEHAKRKKSKKKSKEILEEAIEEPQNEVHVEKKKKKKKDKKIKKQSDDISSAEEEFKDGGKSEEVSLELTNKTEALEPSCLEETIVAQDKKKKRKDETSKTKTLEPSCLEETIAAQHIKKKKKKRKDEKENESELENRDLFIPETTKEPKVKVKKSKKEKDVEKPENEEVEKGRKAEPSEEVKPVPGTNNNPKDSKPGDEKGNEHVIHSHKAVLFKKKDHKIILPRNYSDSRVLSLVCGADIQKFKGSNLSDVLGYGMRKETGKRKETR